MNLVLWMLVISFKKASSCMFLVRYMECWNHSGVLYVVKFLDGKSRIDTVHECCVRFLCFICRQLFDLASVLERHTKGSGVWVLMSEFLSALYNISID